MDAPHHLLEVLKSETFWIALQSLSALAGIVFLVRYTSYTKRMMELQLETRRAEIAPVFTLSSLGGSANTPTASQITDASPSPSRNIHLKVRNIGKGPALRFKGWHGPVDPTFRLNESQMLKRRHADQGGVSTSFEVLANEAAEIVFQNAGTSRYWLCVLECQDTGGHKHQFQLIRMPQTAVIDPWLMVHGWSASYAQQPPEMLI
jgi:hypothetical protein